jgi:hypothetical protein
MGEQQEKGIRIFFNDKPVFAPKDTWTGAELRDFFKVPTQYQLYKETPGKAHPDALIKPEEFDMKSSMYYDHIESSES